MADARRQQHGSRALQHHGETVRRGGNTTPTVRLTGQRSHNMGSLITTCHGDEAGTGGGVKSGTVGNQCEPLEHSSAVRSEGKFMVRHNDLWWMNNKNTVGRLLWIKESDAAELTPHSRQGWEALAGRQYAQAAPATMPDAARARAGAGPAAAGRKCRQRSLVGLRCGAVRRSRSDRGVRRLGRGCCPHRIARNMKMRFFK